MILIDRFIYLIPPLMIDDVVIFLQTGLAEDWPTDEMLSRCTWSNFYVGIPTAFFSGLGVAVSLLDDQTNSLVCAKSLCCKMKLWD